MHFTFCCSCAVSVELFTTLRFSVQGITRQALASIFKSEKKGAQHEDEESSSEVHILSMSYVLISFLFYLGGRTFRTFSRARVGCSSLVVSLEPLSVSYSSRWSVAARVDSTPMYL